MVGDRTYWKGNSPKFITLEDVDKLSSLASKHLHAESQQQKQKKEGEKFVQTKKKDNRNDIIPASIASFPANISLFQVDKISTRKRC